MKINISKSWPALSFWLVSIYCTNTLSAHAADSIAIRNIYVNTDKQLVVEFDNSAHINPSAPQVLDYPGEKHDIILEFSNTSFAVGKVPRAKAVLDELTKIFPSINSIAYAASNDATRARIRLSISKDITTHPTLVKIDQDVAIVNLDLPPQAGSESNKEIANAPATATTTTTVITAAPPITTTPVIAAAPPVTTTPVIAATTPVTTTPVIAATTQATTPVSEQPTATPVSSEDKQPAETGENTGGAKPAPIATTNPAVSTTPSGLTSKTMHGIKGAWQSSLKAGSGLGKFANLFGSKKQVVPSEQTGPQEPSKQNGSPVSSEPVSTTPVADNNISPIAAPPTTTPAPATETISPTAAPPTTTPAPATETISPTAAPPTTTPAPATETVSSTVPSTTNTSTTVQPKPDTTPSSIPAPKALPAAIDNTDNTASATTPALAPAPDVSLSTNTDARKLDLPRIVVQPQEAAESQQIKNDLITPLKPDEVKPEQKSVPSAVNTPEIAPPLTTKTIEGDPTVTADLKTGFSKANDKAQKESKESAAPQIASAVPSDFTGNLPAKETGKTVTRVELKSMTAHNGGKDYFPPTASTNEKAEPIYTEETLKHYNEAVRFHLAGKLPEAVAEYHAALAGNPRMEEAHSNLGLIFNQQNKYDQAMAEFHKALAINPKDAITFNGIGAAMRAQKNMLAAVKNWQTALSLDPNLASAHYNLGTAYELDKDLERALTEYKLAVKCDDKLGEAYYHMGLILQKMDNRPLALEQFKQAVKVSAQADYSQDAKHRVNLLSQKKNINM